MELSKMVIGVLCVALVVGVFALLIAEVGSNSAQNLDDISNDSLDSFNKLNTITELSNNVSKQFNSSEEANTFDLLGFYFKKGYLGIKTLTASGDVVTTLTGDMSDKLELNSIFSTVLGSMLGVAILFLLISAVMKWRV